MKKKKKTNTNVSYKLMDTEIKVIEMSIIFGLFHIIEAKIKSCCKSCALLLLTVISVCLCD